MSAILSATLLALTAIRRNGLRSALTVLGITIGVAAVVIVTALGMGASEKVGGQIDSFASNAIFISPQSTQQSGARSKAQGRLTEADAKAIAQGAVSVAGASAFLSTMGQVVYADRNAQTAIYGVTLSYFPIRRFTVDKGSLWTETDDLLKTKVCVLGPTVVEKLFGGADPIGRTIRIGRAPYRVVGTFAPRGTALFGEDQDDRVFVPIGTYRARVVRTSPGRVDMIIAAATSEDTSERAQEQITAILRQRHRIADNAEPDFRVSTQAEFRQKQRAITDVLAMLLLGVAAVSLVVGGIGVMNIMLVSVAERTREIGIRMAIGARSSDILVQFLVEAVLLSLVGGAVGIAMGTFVTLGLGRALEWSMAPTTTSVGVAVATSAGIGVLFGWLPAQRASRLDPIVALRVE